MRRSKVAAVAVSVALLAGACSGLGGTGDRGGGADRQGGRSSQSDSKGGSAPARPDRDVVVLPNKGAGPGLGRPSAPPTSPTPKPGDPSPRPSDLDREPPDGK